MVYENIIFGSGLTALGTALGLPQNQKSLVVTGGNLSKVSYYDSESKVPSHLMGLGGLGNYWHGVIPMNRGKLGWGNYEGGIRLFEEFFPYEDITNKFNTPWLFVPRRPIRPKIHWSKLCETSSRGIELVHDVAKSIERVGNHWKVQISDQVLHTSRLWIAAGPLATSLLFEQSPELNHTSQRSVSDHLILYMGQIDRAVNPDFACPEIEHTKTGYWFKRNSNFGDCGLVTTKPARFSFKKIDNGIEHRSAFGLPASSVVGKMIRAGSMGLFSEALFNKFGLFPNSRMLSVYSQIRIERGYYRQQGSIELSTDLERIHRTIFEYKSKFEFKQLVPSQRPELFIRGIHMHGTVDQDALNQLEINTESSNCFVVDSSVIKDIGDIHHSFRLMARAYERARSVS